MPKNVDTLEEAVSTGATIVGYKAEVNYSYQIPLMDSSVLLEKLCFF